jgi:hypothetical protein
MNLKIHLLFITSVITISCSQPKSKTETPDSTQLQTDTIILETLNSIEIPEVEEVDEPDEPPLDESALTVPGFSFYSLIISEDEREKSITETLSQTVSQFSEEKFVTLEVTYVRGDPVMMGTTRESKIWYYNANRQLRGASSEYKSIRTTENRLYWFSDEELVAMILDSDFYDEGAGYSTNVRIASSSCPLCGLKVTNDDGDGDEVSEVDQYEFNKYADDFFTEHNDLLKTFKDVTNLTRQGERYTSIVTMDSNTGSEPDTIKYSIDPNLVHTFFKNSLIQN